MIVTKEKYSNDAFVLSPGGLQKLAESFQRFIERPTFELECRDGTTRRFDDVAGILSFENRWSNRIRSLWIRSVDDETLRRARVRFSAEHVPVYLEIAAEAEVAAGFHDVIAGALEEMRPSYAVRGVFDLGLALLAGSAAAVTGIFALLAIRLCWQASADAALGGFGVLLVAEAGGFALSLAAVRLACRPPGPLFPRAAFAVGQGIWRKRLLHVLRGVVFLAACGSLIAIIVLNIGT